MRMSAAVLVMFMPILAMAQNYQGMSGADMQKMMQQMQEMQSCMQNVDQADMNKLQQRSRQMEAEVKSLCAAGKRDEAQEKVISFGKQMAKDPAVQTMKKCGEKMQGAMPAMPFMEQGKEHSSHHICD